MGIYIFGADALDRVKVGYTASSDARARMKSVQTGACGHKLRQLGWMPEGTMESERRIHGMLTEAGARIESEWFARGHPATAIVLMHANERHASTKIIRYLEHHLRSHSPQNKWDAHVFDRDNIRITLGNAKKCCTACHRWLPVTSTHWGSLWRRMKDGSLRDQPRCTSCREVPEGYRDDRTGDMFS